VIEPHDAWRDSPSPLDPAVHHRDIDAVPCPTCNADPFVRCCASGGYWSPSCGVHRPRIERARESLGLPARPPVERRACPVCAREVRIVGREGLRSYARHAGCSGGGRLLPWRQCGCSGACVYPCAGSDAARAIARDALVRARRHRVESSYYGRYTCANCETAPGTPAFVDRAATPRGEWPAVRDAFLAAHGWRVEPRR